ncbi:MAG: amidase [Deltaproteobacteria bacterium CG11_big_fil_rev_8_21_14_0_20_45_16]|nr:MAG: amidase [Deltaproteobacteria bacterium CG11_big_fil_rev_8_21_14_0_20_45_16]
MQTKTKNRFFLGLLVLIFGMAIFASMNWIYFKSFPQIISAYYAKEFCSCYYVMKQSEEHCHEWTKQWVPISSFSWDKDRKEIFVEGFFYKSRARWIGERQGCQLMPLP